mgnify:CR=1 FL=1
MKFFLEVRNILNERHLKILDMLNVQQEIDIKFLSEKLFTIPRTIRYDIQNINYYLAKYKLPMIKHSRILKFEKSFKLENFLKNIEIRDYKFSERERIEFIMIRILFNSKEKLTTEKIALDLGVSDLTIKKDIKILREEIKGKDLELYFHKRKGFILIGEEDRIRQKQLSCYISYNIDYSWNSNNSICMDFLDLEIRKILKKYKKDIDVEYLNKYIGSLSASLNKVISNEAHEVLVLYMILMIKRIKNENYIDVNKVFNEYLLLTREYEVISDSINSIESKYKIVIHKNEVLKIVDHLLGSHTYNFDYSFYENWVEIEILVRKIIGEVNKSIDLDILSDELLYESLLNHMKPTIYRIKNNIFFPDLILDEIMSSDENLLKIVRESLTEIENYINCKISDVETALFTVHFKLAIDRAKEKQMKILRVLLVCSTGYATSSLLSQQLSELYNIEIIELIPYYKVFEYDLAKIDIIVTTIDIERRFLKKDIDVIKVGVVLSDLDKKNFTSYGISNKKVKVKLTEILEILRDLGELPSIEMLGDSLVNKLSDKIIDDRKKEKDTLEFGLSKFLTEKNIEMADTLLTWQETVYKAGNILLEKGYINENYIKNIIGNIEKNGVYMVLKNGFILLHAEKMENVYKTGIAFLKQKRLIDFPGAYKVSNILVIACYSKSELTKSFGDILHLSENKSFLLELEKAQNSKMISALVEQYT